MKLVHSSISSIRAANEWLEKAKQYEKDEDWKAAVSAYEKVIRSQPLNEFAYHRLMIIHRKQRDAEAELKIINKGIRTFREHFQSGPKKKLDSRIARISKALLKSTGLADRKGNPIYEPQPLARWNLRRVLVENKVNKAKREK